MLAYFYESTYTSINTKSIVLVIGLVLYMVQLCLATPECSSTSPCRTPGRRSAPPPHLPSPGSIILQRRRSVLVLPAGFGIISGKLKDLKIFCVRGKTYSVELVITRDHTLFVNLVERPYIIGQPRFRFEN